MRQLDPQHSRLYGVEAAIGADFLVVVAFAAAMISQADHPIQEGRIIGGDRPRISKGAQVLGGIKAKGSSGPHRSSFFTFPGCAYRLGGILDDYEFVLGTQTAKRSHVCALAV